MKTVSILKKRIIIESLSLFFLVFCIIYSSISIKRTSNSEIENTSNFVAVLDDKKYNPVLEELSDAQAESLEGITYVVTNNNNSDKGFNILIEVNEDDKEIIDNIMVSVDDLYIFKLSDLEKKDNYYVLYSDHLRAGYTKKYLIKSWYKLNSGIESNKKIKYKFKLDINQ